MRKFIRTIVVLALAVLLCFTVISASALTYKLGDADGDGEVTLIDATVVQRVLAYMQEDPDGGIALRGDIDANESLEAIDATFIMRYNAEMDVPYPVNSVISDEPTEPPTEAPTQAPTSERDPYELPLVP